MLLYAATQAEDKKNILFSHFTYVSYDQLLPLKSPNGSPNSGKITVEASRIYVGGTILEKASVLLKHPYLVSGAIALGKLGKMIGTKNSAFCDTNLGSFTKNIEPVLSLIASNKIHYTVSGHAHRCGIYCFNGDVDSNINYVLFMLTNFQKNSFSKILDNYMLKNFMNIVNIHVSPLLDNNGIIPVSFDLPQDKSISIVSGSAGPLSIQNIEGEFAGFGLDKPQGLVFSPKKNNVRVHRSERFEPRLASVMSALQDIGEIYPFENISGYQESEYMLNQQNFYIELNPTWMEIFGGCPFDMLKLHISFMPEVSLQAAESVKIVLNVKSFSNTRVLFHQDNLDIADFIDSSTSDLFKSNQHFFVTMHFSDQYINKKNKFLRYYDLGPWAFPVFFDKKAYYSTIRFISQDIPNFEFYSQFSEYK